MQILKWSDFKSYIFNRCFKCPHNSVTIYPTYSTKEYILIDLYIHNSDIDE